MVRPPTRRRSGQLEVLSVILSDSDPAKPQYDTFGGKLDPRDDAPYHRCAHRELREEFNTPRKWKGLIGLELASFIRGHRTVHLQHPRTGAQHSVATWLIPVPADLLLHYQPVAATTGGLREMVEGSLKWRPFDHVTANL
eukprot:4667587-Prymnesium_polylepis.1